MKCNHCGDVKSRDAFGDGSKLCAPCFHELMQQRPAQQQQCRVQVTNEDGEWVRCRLPQNHAQRDCEPSRRIVPGFTVPGFTVVVAAQHRHAEHYAREHGLGRREYVAITCVPDLEKLRGRWLHEGQIVYYETACDVPDIDYLRGQIDLMIRPLPEPWTLAHRQAALERLLQLRRLLQA